MQNECNMWFVQKLKEVPAITTEDVIGSLYDLYREKGRAGARLQVEDLLQHIAKERDLASPEELCIRIAGIG
jgi:hypothetical protein